MINTSQNQFFLFVLQPVSINISSYCIRDFFSFGDYLCNEPVLHNKMCSCGIKNLFTNAPLEVTISICLEQLYSSNLNPLRIPKHVCRSLLCMSFKNIEFRFNNYMYRQGSPLGIVLAIIFVGYYEAKLFQNIQNLFQISR